MSGGGGVKCRGVKCSGTDKSFYCKKEIYKLIFNRRVSIVDLQYIRLLQRGSICPILETK